VSDNVENPEKETHADNEVPISAIVRGLAGDFRKQLASRTPSHRHFESSRHFFASGKTGGRGLWSRVQPVVRHAIAASISRHILEVIRVFGNIAEFGHSLFLPAAYKPKPPSSPEKLPAGVGEKLAIGTIGELPGIACESPGLDKPGVPMPGLPAKSPGLRFPGMLIPGFPAAGAGGVFKSPGLRRPGVAMPGLAPGEASPPIWAASCVIELEFRAR
jgi:hypothetical protein